MFFFIYASYFMFCQTSLTLFHLSFTKDSGRTRGINKPSERDVEYLQRLLAELSECDTTIRRNIKNLIHQQLHPEDEGVQRPNVVTSRRWLIIY